MLPDHFICGVVEGFYGRPWTTDHRQELFKRMRRMGLSTYVYAPKDDLKHRAYWRDQYNADEAEHLEALIRGAETEGVEFVYALSPGIDITYSSPKEVALVKKKLQQVREMGCNSFALLFDDIEPVMSEADRGKFGSFAEAQVAVTNEVHETLSSPPKHFLFCPTEYCESRAVPTLARSAYLNHIGQKLLPPIHILWTGPRVISRVLSAGHLKAVSEVLRRKPLIWDNLHANDYDNRRVFFGPYSGRPMEAKEWMAGVVTNPNCEFEANFVALDSLAQWARSDADASVPPEGATGATLEAGGVEPVASKVVEEAAPLKLYHPANALAASLRAWLPEFFVGRNAMGKALVNDPAPVTDLVLGINTCASSGEDWVELRVTCTTQSGQKHPLTSAGPSGLNPSGVPGESLVTGPLPIYTPSAVAAAVINPFAPPPLVAEGLSISEKSVEGSAGDSEDPVLSPAMQALNSLTDNYGEPMDMDSKLRSAESLEALMDEGNGTTENSSAVNAVTTTTVSTTFAQSSTTTRKPEMRDMDEGFGDVAPAGKMSLDDLHLLAELFYLPFEHGSREYAWLRRNSHVVRLALANSNDRVMDEWQRRAKNLTEMTRDVRRLYLRLVHSPNRSMVQDLYPYVWEVERVMGLVSSIVEWIGSGQLKSDRLDSASARGGGETNPNNENEAAAQLSAESEPWVLRGGLIGELVASFPMENAGELLTVRPPYPVPEEVYRITPYLPAHKNRLFAFCRANLHTIDCSIGDRPELAANAFLGGFLEQSPNFCFLIDRVDSEAANDSDAAQIVAAVLAVVDVDAVRSSFQGHLQQLRHQTIASTKPDAQQLAAIDAWLSDCGTWLEVEGDGGGKGGFSSFLRPLIPVSLPSPTRLALTAVLSTLKLSGSAGVFAERRGVEGELLSRCGFYDLPESSLGGTAPIDDQANHTTFVARYI